MQKLFNKYSTGLVISIIFSLLFLAGCSEDFPTAAETANVTTPTGITDQNSFTISIEKLTVEGANWVGSTNEISVFAADRNNNAIPDNTVINFLTNAGALIQNACATVDGTCSVTWRSQNPDTTSGYATVIAYTLGEESFLDLNDNDAFDAGETILDITEPFIDTVTDSTLGAGNGTHDATTEEFVDFNGDNLFTGGDGLYTGASCVGDATVCNRSNLLVWLGTRFGVSGGSSVTYIGPSTVAVDGSAFIGFTIVDAFNGIPMATGTTVSIAATGGTVTTTSFTATGGFGDTFFGSNYDAPSSAEGVTFTITIVHPESGVTEIYSQSISVP